MAVRYAMPRIGVYLATQSPNSLLLLFDVIELDVEDIAVRKAI